MSPSAAHADAFYSEVLEGGTVWAIRDADGFPAPDSSGRRAMPFWSSETRAQKVIDGVDDYREFAVVPIGLEEWRSRWLPGLTQDDVLVGLNWSGERATGFDLDPDDVERNLARRSGGRAR